MKPYLLRMATAALTICAALALSCSGDGSGASSNAPGSDVNVDSEIVNDTSQDSPGDGVDDAPAPGAHRFFRADSLWNTPISNEPVNWKDEPKIRSACWYVNYHAYSNPVVFGSDSDPLVTIPAPSSWGWPATELKLRVPMGVTGAEGTDASLVVINDNIAYDFWQFNRTSDTQATVRAWGQAHLVNDTGWWNPTTKRGAGIRAGGSSGLAGEIVGNELTEGIPHALAVAVVAETSGLDGNAVPPAGKDSGDGVMEGLRLGIPPTATKPSGLSVQGSHMWDALMKYGAWVADRSGGKCPILFNADPRSVPKDDITKLHKDLDKIKEHVRVIDYEYPYSY